MFDLKSIQNGKYWEIIINFEEQNNIQKKNVAQVWRVAHEKKKLKTEFRIKFSTETPWLINCWRQYQATEENIKTYW